MKGQNIATMTIFVMVFMLSGNLVVSIASSDAVSEKIEYSIGDFNTVTNAKIRAESYVERMDRELNYSSNIVALRDSPDRNWPSIPSKDRVEDNYEQRVREEVNTQAVMAGGCNAPEIASVHASTDTSMTASLRGGRIMCGDKSSRAWVALPEISLDSGNYDNRYLELGFAAVDLAEGIQSELPESWPEGTGSSSSGCKQNPDESLYKESAKTQAKKDAIQDSSLAETVASNGDLADWIDIETSSSFTADYTQTSSSSESCDWEHTGHEVPADTDGDGTIEEGETETHVHEDGGTDVSYAYSADITDAALTFTLSDSEKQVINSEADQETISFIFDYSHSFN